MKRLALLPLIALLALGCSESSDLTGAADLPSVRGNRAAPEGRINQLITALFPEPDEGAAHRLFAEIKSSREQGALDAARTGVFELLASAGRTDLDDPPGETTTAEAHVELIRALFDFVDLDAPEINPEILSGETDGVVQVAFPDQDNLIVTASGFAGTFIEEGDLDEETLVVIERLDPDAQSGGDCLPLAVDQEEGCYRFEKSPEITFLDDVLVGVCPVPAIRDETDPNAEQFQLGKFDPENPGQGVLFLSSASAGFLDCSGFTALASAGNDGLGQLASAAWRAAGRTVLRWLGPAPAEAVNLGFGGTLADFSRIGWARPLDVELVFPEPGVTGALAGSTVDVGIRVTAAHSPSDPPPGIGGVPVNFGVIAGGGSVSPATVTTDGQGFAAVDWTLGPTIGATNTLRISAPGDTVQRSLLGEALE